MDEAAILETLSAYGFLDLELKSFQKETGGGLFFQELWNKNNFRFVHTKTFFYTIIYNIYHTKNNNINCFF